jgi:hypothetical protein
LTAYSARGDRLTNCHGTTADHHPASARFAPIQRHYASSIRPQNRDVRYFVARFSPRRHFDGLLGVDPPSEPLS